MTKPPRRRRPPAQLRRGPGTEDEAYLLAEAYECTHCGARAQVDKVVTVRHYPGCPRSLMLQPREQAA